MTFDLDTLETTDVTDVTERINTRLKDGWLLIGTPAFFRGMATKDGNVWFRQNTGMFTVIISYLKVED